MWVTLVKTSFVLGRILLAHYRLKAAKASVEEIEGLAAELLDCQQKETPINYEPSGIASIHEYHLQVFYQFVQPCSVRVSDLTYVSASVTDLYRPYILNAPSSFPENSSAIWQKVAQNRAREAVLATNQALEKIIDLDLVKSIKPMFLRDTYWSAGVMYQLFDRARDILDNRNNRTQDLTTTQNFTAPSNVNHQVFEQEGNEPTVEIMTSNLAPFIPDGASGVLGAEDFASDFDANYSTDFDALE
ncbi:hypothetical protein N7520_006948 [Penicillium odoratum]|uniref:uncharacterized protein n=1 Tax=Penicillium odoratum TaxID=1167516 RepID=UPI00254776F6|nr:uncharacterized protein N7520_006948 [Penicillium odoratum]KAJ5759792.1 hypothetical protein N7520_006948 [Penicillium odoratum]